MAIYLDNAATTAPDPRVLERMQRLLAETYGNPASLHRPGVAAAAAVERARAVIASALGAEPDEVVFTSGGTEANNLAVKGVALARGAVGRHIVTSAIEHPSVLEAVRSLESLGFTHTVVPVDGDGRVHPEDVARALRADTVLVSVLHASNEVGTIQPIAELAGLCRAHGVPLHTDACQSFTRAPLGLRPDGPDLVSINAHKIHGPKGVGALVVRRGVPLEPLFHGGGQEGGLRSGTVNAPAIAGFAEAVRCVDAAEPARIAALRDRLVAAILAGVPGARLNGAPTARLCHHASLTLPGVSAKRLMQALSEQGIYISTGSACASGKTAPSHVLVAMGRTPREADESIRMTLGRWTTADDVDAAIAAVCAVASTERRHGDSDAR